MTANDNKSPEEIAKLKEAFENVKSIANKANAAFIITEHNVSKEFEVLREIITKAVASVEKMEKHLNKREGDISKK